VAKTPGLAEILANDWKKAARFYARFGITERLLVHGAGARDVPDAETWNVTRYLARTFTVAWRKAETEVEEEGRGCPNRGITRSTLISAPQGRVAGEDVLYTFPVQWFPVPVPSQ
jgi:hypothetical protein